MGKKVIDIASMNIEYKNEFIYECKDGLKKGFDGKFIIHPWQLEIFNSIKQYSEAEMEFAKLVKNYIDEIGGKEKFTIAKIEGKIVEKPHLNRFNEILRNTGYGTF
jgi:citrate lyase beta subunit